MTVFAGSGLSCHADSYQAGRQAAEAALAALPVRPAGLLLAFTTDHYNQPDAVRGIRDVGVPAALMGCCTGGLMTAQGNIDQGVAVLALQAEGLQAALVLRPNLSMQPRQVGEAAAEAVEAWLPPWHSGKQAVGLVLADGLLGAIGMDQALQGAAAVFGPFCPLVGGAAGDNLGYAQTSVFVNDQIVGDSFALGMISSAAPVGIGVRHGWRPIGRQFVITRSAGNMIYELDGKPAFQGYRDLFPGEEITPENFRTFTRYRPIGFPQMGSEFLVRLPRRLHPGGAIECVGSLPESAVATIMQGDPASLVAAAEEAARQAVAALGGRRPAAAIIIDCVTRPPLLGAEVQTEISRMLDVVGPATPMIGMYSFGEIAAADGPVAFHNKTVVVCVIGQDEEG